MNYVTVQICTKRGSRVIWMIEQQQLINEEVSSDGLKVLNLYAGLGGNRQLWDEIIDDLQVTAVEIDENIAAAYKDNFSEDRIIIADAHEYLLQHYDEYDFIWSSPPCQTHSSLRQNLAVRYRGTDEKYPDMSIYEEIIFLQHNHEGKWVVENVNPYYEPLIEPAAKLQRHLLWSNFPIVEKEYETSKLRSTNSYKELEELHGIQVDGYGLDNKRKALRNCVKKEIGKHILKCALNQNDLTSFSNTKDRGDKVKDRQLHRNRSI